MKSAIPITLFLLSVCLLQAQPQKATMPFGVTWTSTIADVEQIVAAQPGVTLDIHNHSDSADRFIYKGGTHLGYPVHQWEFAFKRGVLRFVNVYIDNESSTVVIDAYVDIAKQMRSIYGKPVREVTPELCKDFRETFGDPDLLLKCMDEEAGLYHFWQIGPKSDRQLVSAKINESGMLQIGFIHLTRAKVADPF